MARNSFKSGEWNVICMVCNRKIKSGDALKRWDGLIVCADDYENRHPMDFLRTRQERISVPFTSDTSYDSFNGPIYPPYPFCTAEGASGVAMFAVAGCARPGLGFPNMLPVPQPEIPDEPILGVMLYMDKTPIALVDGSGLVEVAVD